jgi:cobalt-zinc-cadmium efflux system protein
VCCGAPVSGPLVAIVVNELASVRVVVAGVIVAVTGSVVADPVVSLLIAALILWSSYDVCRDLTCTVSAAH